MFKCYLCDKDFTSKFNLDRHKDKKNPCNKIKESNNCNICKSNFKSKYDYERHEKTTKHIINIKNIPNINNDIKISFNELKLKEENDTLKLHIIDNKKLYENKLKILNDNNILLQLENNLLKKKNKLQKIKKDDEIINLKLENQYLKFNKKSNNLVGNIYKIEYNKNSDIRYIGSTTKTLKNRYSSHKSKYNKWLENNDYAICEIYEYFKIYGIENFEIILLKEYEILNKKHLLVYEQLWMNKMNNINKNKAFAPINIEKHKLKYESLLNKIS